MADETQLNKPGAKSTEFWLTLGQNLAGGGLVFGLPEDHWAVKVAVVAGTLIQNLFYIWARTKLKSFE